MEKVLSVVAVLTMATLHVQAAGFGLFGSSWSSKDVDDAYGGGVGYVFLDGRVAGRDVDVDDEVGWYGVTGLEFELSDNVAIFGEAM